MATLHMVDWLGSIGKEEASKLQAAGILAGFHGKPIHKNAYLSRTGRVLCTIKGH